MLHEVIGTPAMLEQTAEECCELAQACLKMSRLIRKENDPHKSYERLYDNLCEEMADVEICMFELQSAYEDVKMDKDVMKWRSKKLSRIIKRIADSKSGEDNQNGRE